MLVSTFSRKQNIVCQQSRLVYIVILPNLEYLYINVTGFTELFKSLRVHTFELICFYG
jgi:hypothetical protein